MPRYRFVAACIAAGALPAAVAYSAVPPAPISNYADLMRIMNNAANWLFGILLVLAVIFVILAAYKYLNGAGDPKAVETAKQQILYALLAVAIAVLSKTLINAVGPIISKLST